MGKVLVSREIGLENDLLSLALGREIIYVSSWPQHVQEALNAGGCDALLFEVPAKFFYSKQEFGEYLEMLEFAIQLCPIIAYTRFEEKQLNNEFHLARGVHYNDYVSTVDPIQGAKLKETLDRLVK